MPIVAVRLSFGDDTNLVGFSLRRLADQIRTTNSTNAFLDYLDEFRQRLAQSGKIFDLHDFARLQ